MRLKKGGWMSSPGRTHETHDSEIQQRSIAVVLIPSAVIASLLFPAFMGDVHSLL
jgi:hypothetical protein